LQRAIEQLDFGVVLSWVAVAAKNSDKLTKAAERTAESVLDYLSTLPPQKAKAMREEIRQLAAKASRRAA